MHKSIAESTHYMIKWDGSGGLDCRGGGGAVAMMKQAAFHEECFFHFEMRNVFPFRTEKKDGQHAAGLTREVQSTPV